MSGGAGLFAVIGAIGVAGAGYLLVQLKNVAKSRFVTTGRLHVTTDRIVAGFDNIAPSIERELRKIDKLELELRKDLQRLRRKSKNVNVVTRIEALLSAIEAARNLPASLEDLRRGQVDFRGMFEQVEVVQ